MALNNVRDILIIRIVIIYVLREGGKMLFVSDTYFMINDWKNDDSRIHKKPNCKYSDNRDWLDIVYELIKNDMLEKEI